MLGPTRPRCCAGDGVLERALGDARALAVPKTRRDPCFECYRVADSRCSARTSPRIAVAGRRSRPPRFRGFRSVHAIPMRVSRGGTHGRGDEPVSLPEPGRIGEADLSFRQGMADIAAVALLQERTVRESRGVIAGATGRSQQSGGQRAGPGNARRVSREWRGRCIRPDPRLRPGRQPSTELSCPRLSLRLSNGSGRSALYRAPPLWGGRVVGTDRRARSRGRRTHRPRVARGRCSRRARRALDLAARDSGCGVRSSRAVRLEMGGSDAR